MRATSATVGNGVSMIVGFDMNRAYSFGTTRSTEANPLANRSVVESQGRSDGTAVKRKSALEYWWPRRKTYVRRRPRPPEPEPTAPPMPPAFRTDGGHPLRARMRGALALAGAATI